MRFSSRLPHFAQRNELSALLAAKLAAGERILDLTQSNPTHAGIEYPKDFLAALTDSRAAAYEPEPFGLMEAREIVAHEHGVSASQVVLTASTSEAYAWIFKMLCDPGDEILVPRPSYPLFEYLAALENVSVRHYSLFYDHGWFIDFHALAAAVTPRTRAVILVNPNNPTGHFIRRHEADELRRVCDRHDLALICDEVFSSYILDPAPDGLLSLTGLADFTLHGLSKAAGLPQLKLAWTIARENPGRLEMIADTYLSVSAPVQYALGSLLALGSGVQAQINERVRRNRGSFPEALRMEGGWYAILRTLHEEETALSLLRDRNILVQPGYFYDFERSGYLVVSLLTHPGVLEEALAKTGGRPHRPELYDWSSPS